MIAPPAPAVRPSAGLAHRLPTRLVWVLATVAVLLVVVVLSLSVGSRGIPPATVWEALFGRGTPADVTVVLQGRVPRTIAGLLVGAGIGVAGALIQAVTRNPLADPGILGVNFGAAFAIAIAVGVFGITAPLGYVWFGLGGALVTTVAVYLIGSAGRGSVNPLQITLAGVALGAVLSGIISAMLLANPQGFNAMIAWRAGSLQDRSWDAIAVAAPFVLLGVVLAVALGRALNAVALGDDLAGSLGANVTATRALSLLAITLLAGAATAVAGPIAFVGLMIPHLARWIVGPDQRWIIGYSLLLAPILLLVADIVGRVILWPGELQVGIVTAFLGAPVLIVLVRRQRVSGL
ncbi:iron chelate uptake ABC transporter family permease subunit [Leifsonia sp. NPDC058292]|uniref:iron chelate uptake ABC transporter family permease subunit n=1 Tax=Leifsonia sp. NPDC058292 TaxID=3346428 RepID=UPI0036DBF8D4